MEKYVFGIVILFALLGQACTDRDIIDAKEGVSLPPVSDLSIGDAGNGKVRLTWGIPTAIPQAVNQPLNVLVEVRELIESWRSQVVFSSNLADAPTSFDYDLPDPSKTYQFTVKLNGRLKEVDPNYSSTIYSLGQSVSYGP